MIFSAKAPIGETTSLAARRRKRQTTYRVATSSGRAFLPLDTSGDEARCHEALRQTIHDDDGDSHEECCRHKLSFRIGVTKDHLRHTNRQGEDIAALQEDIGEEKLIPGIGQGEERHGEECGLGKRQDDTEEGLKASGTVGTRSVFKLFRDGAIVAHQEPAGEGENEAWIGNDECPEGVCQMEKSHDLVDWDQHCYPGHHVGQQQHRRKKA